MSLSNEPLKIQHNTNGVTTVFSLGTMTFQKAADILVTLLLDGATKESTQLITTNYTVDTGITEITTVGDAWEDGTVVISRNTDQDQDFDWPTAGTFASTSLNNAIDKEAMKSDEVIEKNSRAMLVQLNDETVDLLLPLKADRASKFASYDPDGKPTVTSGVSSLPITNNMEILGYITQVLIADYTVLQAETRSQIMIITAGATDKTITFETPNATNVNTRCIIQKIDSGVGRVILAGAQQANEYLYNQYESVIFEVMEVSTGTYAWVAVKKPDNLQPFFEARDATQELYTGSGKLFEMTSPVLVDNAGNEADFSSAERNGNSGAGKIFTDRGCYYFDGVNAWAELPTQLQNEDAIEFWIFPNWGAGPATQTILDNRAGGDDDLILLRFVVGNTYEFLVQDTGGDSISISSSVIGSPNVLTHIKISWSKAGNVAKMFIDSVDQGAGTTSGSGITNINMAAHVGVTLGSKNKTGEIPPFDAMDAWLTDFLIHGSYDITTTHFTAAKPYYTKTRILGLETDTHLDGFGNIGAAKLWMQGRKVVESGSNTNGNYIIFSDGTLVCYEEKATTVTTNLASGNIFNVTSGNFVFPVVFGSAVGDIIVLTGIRQSSGRPWGGMAVTMTTSTFTFYIMGALATDAGYPQYMAIGKR